MTVGRVVSETTLELGQALHLVIWNIWLVLDGWNIISSTYSWLTRYPGGDDHDLCTFKSLLEIDVLPLLVLQRQIAVDFGRGRDVGEISRDSRCVDDIVECELYHGEHPAAAACW